MLLYKDGSATTSRAIFVGVEVEGQIWLALDKAPTEPGIYIVLLHPPQRDLTKIAQSECEVVYRHDGQPIDVSEYLGIPKERRGFYLVENWS